MAYIKRVIRERFRAGLPISIDQDPFLHLIQQAANARAEGRLDALTLAIKEAQREPENAPLGPYRWRKWPSNHS